MRTEEEIIARLIVSIPFSSNSPFSIFEIAKDIEDLRIIKGGLQEISSFIGVSEGMLNQFLRVNKLTPKGIELVANRTIDSISVVHNLAKFSEVDQNSIISEILAGNVKNTDIRLLSPLRKQFPNKLIHELIEQLKKSENQKVSIIKFDINDLNKNIEALRDDINKIIDSSELIELSTIDKIGTIKITPKGEAQLRKAAKLKHKTLEDFIYSILQ